MFGCYLHSIIWKYAGGMMYFKDVFGKYGKFINGFNGDYFLWWSYGGDDTHSNA